MGEPAASGPDPTRLLAIDEEVDLTQLLEELKRWDPVLPEPRVREHAGQSDVRACGRCRRPDGRRAGLPGRGRLNPRIQSRTCRATTHRRHRPMPVQPPTFRSTGRHRLRTRARASPNSRRSLPTCSTTPTNEWSPSNSWRLDGCSWRLASSPKRRGPSSGPRSSPARVSPRRWRWPSCTSLAVRCSMRSAGTSRRPWRQSPMLRSSVRCCTIWHESLEALGEADRALGVLLDLLSQVEDYRDARARLDRLLRVDAGG